MTIRQHHPHAVIGAGGHGREIALVLNRAPDAYLAGIYDDREPDPRLVALVDASWLGPVPATPTDAYIGIGNPAVRRAIATRLEARPPAVVDPSAVVAPDTSLADGVVVFALTAISTNVSLGQHTHVCARATIAHDCRVGQFVTVMPGVALGGQVRIGDNTYIGANASIAHSVTVGSNVTISTGSVVMDDVADGVTVAGNPARGV